MIFVNKKHGFKPYVGSLNQIKDFFSSLGEEKKLSMFDFDLVQRAEFIYIEKEGDEIAGIIGIYKTAKFVPTLFIVVKKCYQGKGIGERLMHKEIDFARKTYSFLALSTFDNGKYNSAIYLYKKYGFHVYLKKKSKIWMCTSFNSKGEIICKFLPFYISIIYYVSYLKNSIRDKINSISG